MIKDPELRAQAERLLETMDGAIEKEKKATQIHALAIFLVLFAVVVTFGLIVVFGPGWLSLLAVGWVLLRSPVAVQRIRAKRRAKG
jgi:fatty acid desaturase